MKSRAFFFLASALLALALGELAARRILALAPDSGFQDPAGFYSYHLGLTKWEGGNWLRNLTPHPYFGYVMAQEGTAANNYGFNDPESFPYRKKSPNEYVIAVLGGSVALGWGGWIQNLGRDYFVAALVKKIPALAKRKIVILDMAMGGFKQPQQLYIASYFLDSVDLFVNLEGHNELNAYTNQPVFPLEYPIGAYLYFWHSRQSVEASRSLRFLAALNHSIISGGASNGFLRTSGLYFALAKNVFRFVTNRSIAAAEEAKKALENELKETRKTFFPVATPPGQPEDAVRVWERFAVQEQRLLSASGRKVIFFLQPNQYLPGSKPYSDWESKNAITSDFQRKGREYSLLPEAAKRMKRAGVNMHDLTMIYAEEKDTVYADSCCHLNEKGNRLITDAIVSRLSQSLKLP